MHSTEDINDYFNRELKGSSMEDCIKKVLKERFYEFCIIPNTFDFFKRAIALEIEEERIRIELLRRISEELFPGENEAARHYVIHLLEMIKYEKKEKLAITLQIIRDISELRFPDSLVLARLYATGLKSVLEKQERSEQIETLELIRRIKEERFVKDDYIQSCYDEGYLIVSGLKAAQNNKNGEENVADSETEGMKIPKIFNILKLLYTGYDLQLDSDQFATEYFNQLCQEYQALKIQKGLVELVPIKSNKGKIHVFNLTDNNVYSIIWDLNYWELLEKFCYAFELLKEDNLNFLGITMEKPVVEILLYLLSELFLYLHKYNMKYDSDLSEWCGIAANEFKKLKKVIFEERGGIGIGYIRYSKVYVLHHELEHILWDLELEKVNNAYNFNTFLLLLSSHYKRIEDSAPEDEKIHEYTKEEYLNRMRKLINGEGKWKDLQEELFFDWGAFMQMIRSTQLIMKISKEDAIKNTLICSKIYNMFRTWLYLAKRCTEDASHFKKHGRSMEQLDEYASFRPPTPDDADEIEFRQVINHSLCVEGLVFTKEIEVEEFDKYNNCVDPFVSIYQSFIVPQNKTVQQVVISQYLKNTE